MKRVAVVGAGAAGLCCARHLLRFPEKFQFTVYEQSEHVGGVWMYQNSAPGQLPKDVREVTKREAEVPYRSTMYKNLRTNLPKEIMLFPGFPMNEQLPSFVEHTDVQTYLKEYADQYRLNKFIQFGQLVERVSPVSLHDHSDSIDSVKWTVTTQNLATGQSKSEDYDLVLACNGHFSNPQIPDFKGLSSFSRPVFHSCFYKEPEPFAGQSVLVIGAGPSGIDLMVDLSSHAKVVYLCTRKGPLETKLPANVQQLPGITEFKEDGRVCFENGEEITVDCVVLATGYKYSFPFLTDDSGIKVEQGKWVTYLYKHTFNVAHPSLAIVGINQNTVPFPLFDLQVQWILAVWGGEKTLPSHYDMLKDVEDTYQKRLQEGYPPHKAGHFLGAVRWELYEQFALLGGTPPIPPLVPALYDEVRYHRSHNVLGYREATVTVTSDTEYSTTYDSDNYDIFDGVLQ